MEKSGIENELEIRNQQLPDNIDDLSAFVIAGRDRLTAVRSAIHAISKLDIAKEVYEQKLQEAQAVAELVTDAEVRLGELTAQIPTAEGKRTDLTTSSSQEYEVTKTKKIKALGFNKNQISQFERMAKYPDAVAQAKIDAKENGTIVTRASVIQKIRETQNQKANLAAATLPKQNEMPTRNFAANERNRCDGMDLMRSIQDDTISAAFFDPEYRSLLDHLAYGNEGTTRGSTRADLPQMTDSTVQMFLCEIDRCLKPSGHLFFLVDKYMLCQGVVPSLVSETKLSIVDFITWDKETAGMGWRTRHRAEYCLVLQKQPLHADGCWNDHGIPDVWEEKIVSKIHPHQKPSELIARLIKAVTVDDDWVLDPCAGSYVVLDACKKTGRNFIGCDIAE